MYQIGEKVVYGSEGACIIEAIEERDYGQEYKEYYKLVPLYRQQSTIYVPVQNEQKGRLRSLMNKSSLEKIVEQTLIAPTEWINDNKRRQQQTMETIKSGDVENILVLIKTIMTHQQEKMLNSRDKEMLQKAQKLVFSEMAAVYELEYEVIVNEMTSKLKLAIQQEKASGEESQ